MKVRTLVCIGYIAGLKDKPNTINTHKPDGEQIHTIEYHKDSNSFIVDSKILIPMSRIQEAIIEETPREERVLKAK